MKIKRAILMLTVISLVVAIPALAKNNVPGDVPAPTWTTGTDPVTDPEPFIETADDFTFNWNAVAEAEKYSVDVNGVVLVNGTLDAELVVGVEVEWEVSFGTSDWNPDNMSAPTITIPREDAEAAKAAAIAEAIAEAGITEVTVEVDYSISAKVKGLDPSDKNPKKRQNNLFSDYLVILAPPPAP